MKINSNIPGPLVHRLRRRWRINFFVETGTSYGDTTELAAIMFDQVWSCDLDPSLVAKAQERLEEYSGVKISVESSPDFLRRVKPELCQPVMYWLDAHWCGGPKPAKECPLLEELEAIQSLKGHSVILVDDLELIESPPPRPHDPKQWPTLEEVKEVLASWDESYSLEFYQGVDSRILAITPGG